MKTLLLITATLALFGCASASTSSRTIDQEAEMKEAQAKVVKVAELGCHEYWERFIPVYNYYVLIDNFRKGCPVQGR